MAATVFISHSCKDNERQPPAGLTPEQAQARSKRLSFARKLRDRLHAKLSKDPRCKVFLDVRGGLKPGDIWQDGLHTVLRSCSGGVVLLSPESLESGWVLKEATILSWRVFLGEHIRLIPVVLGVSDEDLERRGFGALNLAQIQWVRVKDSRDAQITAAIKDIIHALEPILKNPAVSAKKLTQTEVWISDFAQKLARVTSNWAPDLYRHRLGEMCNALAIGAEDRERFGEDPIVNLASHALIATDEQIVRFLTKTGKPSDDLREELKEAVAPLWVDPTPASRLAAGAPGVVAIDATEAAPAREYVLRAFCNEIAAERIFSPTDVTGGSDEDVIAAIEAELASILPIDDKNELRRYLDENGCVFVVLGPGSTRPSVLDKVTESYPELTFVVAAGPKPREKLGSWWGRALFLYPALQPTRESAALRYRNRLNKFVTGTP